MSFISEYISSLKGIEAEEIFDLIIYRPIAYIFVKATYSINITPNQVSVVALLCGIAAGVLFGFGTLEANISGAILYFICNVLDCADGQIARLKHNGTKIGRIIDGSIDYVVSITVFIGVAVGLSRNYLNNDVPLYGFNPTDMNVYVYVWVLTVLAGISSAMHSFFFDFYRNKFLEHAYNKMSSLEGEIAEFEAEKQRLEAENGSKLDKMLVAVYLVYTRLQLKIQSSRPRIKKQEIQVNSKAYYSKNRSILRMWSFIGSTTHITVCIICAFLNRLEIFLLICILPMNIFMLITYIFQKRSNSLLKI